MAEADRLPPYATVGHGETVLHSCTTLGIQLAALQRPLMEAIKTLENSLDRSKFSLFITLFSKIVSCRPTEGADKGVITSNIAQLPMIVLLDG